MTADECDFEYEGRCIPPEEFASFVCPSSELRHGVRFCRGNNAELVTQQEWEDQQAEKLLSTPRTSRDDREMKGFQRT
jgi:hypothetical protein